MPRNILREGRAMVARWLRGIDFIGFLDLLFLLSVDVMFDVGGVRKTGL